MKYLPNQFRISAPNTRVWDLVQDFFNKNGVIWCNGDKRINFLGEGRSIGYNFSNDKSLSQSDNEYWDKLKAPKISLEQLFTLEFKPQIKKFQLNFTLEVEIHADKIVAEKFEISFDTAREIAAMKEDKWVIHCPNQRIFDLVITEFPCRITSGDWKYNEKYSCICSKGSYADKDFFMNRPTYGPLITLEEFFSREPQKEIKIGRHVVKVEDDIFTIGCKSISREKINELVSMLPK